MKTLNPAFLEALAIKINSSPFYDLTSMVVKEIGWGRCIMEVHVQERHLQLYGMVHGGVFASLVDSASYWAVFTQIDDDMKMITIDLKLNYLGSAYDGVLIAKGKSIKVGKTLCMGETAITNKQGKLLACGTSTMMLLKDLEISGDLELPRRLLDWKEVNKCH